jgi:hypothetical protein
MPKLLLSIIIEACVAVSVAGVILALVVPALKSSDSVGDRDPAAMVVIVAVLVAAIAVALFRPGSAIHRYIKR